MAVALADHFSADERASRGRDARRRVTPAELAGLASRRDRSDPLEVLQADGASRGGSAPARHDRMLQSPLAFLRGAAAIMAADLARTPSTGLDVQLCGDAHLFNFDGFVAGDGRRVFDIVDFDETARGPFEWDVKRLVASVAVAAADREFRPRAARRAVVSAAAAYRRTMQRWAATRPPEALPAWAGAGARALTSSAVLPAFAADWLDCYRGSLAPSHRMLLDRFGLVDVTAHVDAAGSRSWAVRLRRRGGSDLLTLRAKQAQRSVLAPHVALPERYEHSRRVVEGQRLMQAGSDVFLGWTSSAGPDGVRHDCWVRQSLELEGCAERERQAPDRLAAFAASCGAALAAAHARSGDSMAIAAYLGDHDTFDDAMAEFAAMYADVTAHDHAILEYAVRVGAVTASAA